MIKKSLSRIRIALTGTKFMFEYNFIFTKNDVYKKY